MRATSSKNCEENWNKFHVTWWADLASCICQHKWELVEEQHHSKSSMNKRKCDVQKLACYILFTYLTIYLFIHSFIHALLMKQPIGQTTEHWIAGQWVINYKGFGRKQSWFNLRYLPGICCGGDWEGKKKLKFSPDSWSPDQSLNLQPPYALNHDILCVVHGTDYTSIFQIWMCNTWCWNVKVSISTVCVCAYARTLICMCNHYLASDAKMQ
jgi:hypothetical protein